MSIPESQFDIWSHQGSIQQSAATYATIKNSLEASDAGYAQKNFQVFLQGSYGNDTNIYAESDVDIVIRLDSTYFYDTSDLNPTHLYLFNAALTQPSYLYPDYKTHVTAALRKSFRNDVQLGSKAINILASGNRRSSDVVVTAQFRKYYSTDYGIQYHEGICFFDSGGNQVVNYPKQHSANCTSKHQATGTWFKRMVRIFKNMRGKMVEKGLIADGVAPSYFLEGLLYNVPNNKFGGTFTKTFFEAFEWLIQAERDQLLCANGRYYLVRDSAAECWPTANYDAFLKAMAKLWDEWK